MVSGSAVSSPANACKEAKSKLTMLPSHIMSDRGIVLSIEWLGNFVIETILTCCD
jgi:hypothetical protein